MLASLPFLGGCVFFESSPVAKSHCDPRLVGDWKYVAGKGVEDPKAPIRVDATCNVRFQDPESGRRLRFEALGFEYRGHHYLTLSMADVLAITSFKDGNHPTGADSVAIFSEYKASKYNVDEWRYVSLVRYQLDGGEISAGTPNPDTVKRLIDEGALEGRTQDGAWCGTGEPARTAPMAITGVRIIRYGGGR